jgi:hypothetical protein
MSISRKFLLRFALERKGRDPAKKERKRRRKKEKLRLHGSLLLLDM